MCAMSMVMDSQIVEWQRFCTEEYPPSSTGIEGFRQKVKEAKQYDIDNDQADCELDEKRQVLLTLAKQLGVEIDFL